MSIVSVATAALLFLPLDQLEANEFALRQVDNENPAVKNLFDDIAIRGVEKPISVRPSRMGNKKDFKLTPDGRQIYSVKDGLHRFTGAVKAKLETVPVIVKDETDAQVKRNQIMDNLHVIPTEHYEYGAQLKDILSEDPTIVIGELAAELRVSEDFLRKRMGLTGLHKDGVDAKGNPTSTLGKLVDSGDICLGNALALAKLKPTEEQLGFKDDAVQMKTLEFAKKISDRMTALRKAKMAGKEAEPEIPWSPSAHFRKKATVEAELASPSQLPAILKAKGYEVSTDVIREILKWAVHLDEQSCVEQKNEHEAREKARLDKIAAAKAERERLKKVADDAIAAAKAATVTA